jgi:hypothetical protein
MRTVKEKDKFVRARKAKTGRKGKRGGFWE